MFTPYEKLQVVFYLVLGLIFVGYGIPIRDKYLKIMEIEEAKIDKLKSAPTFTKQTEETFSSITVNLISPETVSSYLSQSRCSLRFISLTKDDIVLLFLIENSAFTNFKIIAPKTLSLLTLDKEEFSIDSTLLDFIAPVNYKWLNSLWAGTELRKRFLADHPNAKFKPSNIFVEYCFPQNSPFTIYGHFKRINQKLYLNTSKEHYAVYGGRI